MSSYAKSKRLERVIVGRESNVIRVNFSALRDPPCPTFPGAAALRNTVAAVS